MICTTDLCVLSKDKCLTEVFIKRFLYQCKTLCRHRTRYCVHGLLRRAVPRSIPYFRAPSYLRRTSCIPLSRLMGFAGTFPHRRHSCPVRSIAVLNLDSATFLDDRSCCYNPIPCGTVVHRRMETNIRHIMWSLLAQELVPVSPFHQCVLCSPLHHVDRRSCSLWPAQNPYHLCVSISSRHALATKGFNTLFQRLLANT